MHYACAMSVRTKSSSTNNKGGPLTDATAQAGCFHPLLFQRAAASL
jgi:hypothetical protein